MGIYDQRFFVRQYYLDFLSREPDQSGATALRKVAEHQAFADRELKPALVLMQYFGSLRRNPNGPPDNNMDGYNVWLGELNQYNNQNNMVKAFITSIEYRSRFGKP